MTSLRDWPEPAPGIIPTKPVMSARECFNWIVFRHAAERDLSGAEEIAALWGYAPTSDGRSSEMLLALREAAGVLTQHDRSVLALQNLNSSWLATARRDAELLVARTEMTRIALIRLLERALRDLRENRHYLFGASRAVTERLAAGALTGWAVATGARLADRVPVQHWATPGLRIWIDGVVAVGDATEYTGLFFYTAEIAGLWPAPSLLPNVGDGGSSASVTAQKDAMPDDQLARATAWMTTHVTRPNQWKREIAIRACGAGVNVTSRVAKEAWRGLPPELRGARGKHKISIIGQD